MEGVGYLAIWSDLAPTDWMHWITREHAAERVGVEGFFGLPDFSRAGHGRQSLLYSL